MMHFVSGREGGLPFHSVCKFVTTNGMQLIRDLELDDLVETEAILADGSKVTLETFICFIDWFGQRIPLQVIANDGRYPLLGTGLFEFRTLHIDYANKVLTID